MDGQTKWIIKKLRCYQKFHVFLVEAAANRQTEDNNTETTTAATADGQTAVTAESQTATETATDSTSSATDNQTDNERRGSENQAYEGQ